MSALRRVLSSAGLVATAASACGASQPASVPPPQCYEPGFEIKRQFHCRFGERIAPGAGPSRYRGALLGGSENAWQAV